MFQLGLFLRALRPAHTGLRPARFTRALPEFKKKKKLTKIINCFFIFQNVIAVFVFSDVKMLVKYLQICAHVFINRPQDQILVVHAQKILFRLCTKLCPNFDHSRARLCPISFAPCPFPNLAGTLLDMCRI